MGRSSSGDSVVAGCVSGSAEPSPVEYAPPPIIIIRTIDSRGQVGAAIPPETLLSCADTDNKFWLRYKKSYLRALPQFERRRVQRTFVYPAILRHPSGSPDADQTSRL